MLNYLLIYFALGLSFAIAAMFVWHETPFLRRLLGVACLWIFWPLMVAAIIHEKWMLKRMSSRCAWCGEEVTLDVLDIATWKTHALVCEKHPLREEIERLREHNKRLTAAAEHNERMAQTEKIKRASMEIDAAFHPRAWKLIKKCKPFVVVAEDEYYYPDVYQMIRHAEILMDRWTPEDQRLYAEAIDRWNTCHGERYGYYPTPEAK